MDCFYHNAVPSVAACGACRRTICATCRDERGLCPGCRLDERLRAASAARSGISGGVGPSYPPPPPPPPPSPPGARVRVVEQGTLAAVSPETRALLALGYPFWPLAALALLNPKRSPAVRRHALQALGLNFGTVGLWLGLAIVAHLPIIGLSAWPLAALLAPIWVAAVVYYGFSVWHGSEVRVPLVSDWLDEHDDDSRVASTR